MLYQVRLTKFCDKELENYLDSYNIVFQGSEIKVGKTAEITQLLLEKKLHEDA